MALNGLRIFLTGFFVYYVSPRLADGFMHYTGGWALFVVAFAVLGGFAWLLAQLEGRAGAAAGGPPPRCAGRRHRFVLCVGVGAGGAAPRGLCRRARRR